MQKAKYYLNLAMKCQLCRTVKYYIICTPATVTLKKINEVKNACRPKNILFAKMIQAAVELQATPVTPRKPISPAL